MECLRHPASSRRPAAEAKAVSACGHTTKIVRDTRPGQCFLQCHGILRWNGSVIRRPNQPGGRIVRVHMGWDIIKFGICLIISCSEQALHHHIVHGALNGNIYAVLAVPNMYGQGGGYVIGEKYLEEIGFEFDEKKVYTLDDLTGIFAAIKEKHPDMYPCGVVTTGKTSSEFTYASGPIDSLGGAPNYTGVLLGESSTTVVNLFESEEYQNYLRHLREWNLAGYIHPDAATMEGTVDSLKAAGVTAGYFMLSAPIQQKKGDVILRLSEPYQLSQGAGGWVIPYRSEAPEAAIKFIDLVWSDAALANLIMWGIEGEHYVVKDASINLIDLPEGVTATNSSYYNTLGIWGDARHMYTFSANNTQEKNDAYTAEASQHRTQGIGISFNMEDVTNEVAAISAVIAQYVPTLESGSVDLDTYYPQFIQALKAAGIDTVIAEKQAHSFRSSSESQCRPCCTAAWRDHRPGRYQTHPG